MNQPLKNVDRYFTLLEDVFDVRCVVWCTPYATSPLLNNERPLFLTF